MSALFIALAVGGGFLLGLRVGLAVAHRKLGAKSGKKRDGSSAR